MRERTLGPIHWDTAKVFKKCHLHNTSELQIALYAVINTYSKPFQMEQARIGICFVNGSWTRNATEIMYGQGLVTVIKGLSH